MPGVTITFQSYYRWCTGHTIGVPVRTDHMESVVAHWASCSDS
eukprot:COSAG02_NODE_45970_length_352_cov_1.600791_1_plen_42_part_01